MNGPSRRVITRFGRFSRNVPSSSRKKREPAGMGGLPVEGMPSRRSG
jgi:hypothetical protein